MNIRDISKTLTQKSIQNFGMGDLILDEYQWCSADRISPEAPVLVCRVNDSTYEAGGAGNVVRNIASLSGKAMCLSRMGQDETAAILKSVLDHAHIDLAGIYESASFVSTKKTRVMAHKQQVVRVDKEECSQPTQDCQSFWMTQLEKELTDTSVLVVSDYYAKGAIQKDLLQKAIGLAKAQGVPVVVDPKGRDFSKYQFSTVITPNMTEFSAVIDGDLGSEDDILKQGVALLKRYQIDILVLTI